MNDFTLDKEEHKRLAGRLKSEVAKIAGDEKFDVWMEVSNEKEGWFNIALKPRSEDYETKPPMSVRVQFQMQREEYDGRKMVKVIYNMDSVMAANGLTMYLVCKYAFDKHAKVAAKAAETKPYKDDEV